MTTEGTRRAIDQIGSWRRQIEDARRAVRRARLAAAGFAAAAVALGVLAILFGLDVRSLAERVEKAEDKVVALGVSAAYARKEAEKLRAARDALAERSAADEDVVERLGRAEEALAAHEDAVRGAGFGSLEEALGHATVHHGQLSYLSGRYGWCLRDRDAAQCALGGEPGCNPATIDFGGEARP